MTIEVENGAMPQTNEKLMAVRQALLTAMRDGHLSHPLLQTLVANVALSDEQRAFVDELLKTSSREAQVVTPVEIETPNATWQPSSDEPATISRQRLRELQQELADMRMANDTVAAALGACPYCWGGDINCELCEGRGRAGFTEPDPDLFDAFVVPAVQRARAINQVRRRPRSRRDPA